MKTKFFFRAMLLLLLLQRSSAVQAQEKTSPASGAARAFTGSVGYRYLNAINWDTIIRTYNFMRPWLTELQPLLTHGFDVHAGYCLHRTKLAYEARIGYGHTASVAENNNIRFKIALNTLDFQLSIQGWLSTVLKSASKHPGFYADLAPALSILMPSVREDRKQIILDDEKKYHPLSLAFNLGLGIGYEIRVNDKIMLAPYTRMQWYPLATLRDFGSAVNGSYLTGLDDQSRALVYSGGIRVVYYH